MGRAAPPVSLFRLLAGLLALAASPACGGSATPAKDPASGGASGKAGADSSNGGSDRPLTHEECQQLGQTIIDTCHGINTRMSTIEGWCSDVVAGVGTGTWVADCEKHIRSMDAMCFSSTNSPKSMMDCDAAVSR
jgi:hypothetical protein